MSFIRQCGSDCGAMQRLQQKSMSDLQGQARATYTLAGSTEVLECRANLSVFVRARPHDARLAFDGDCRSMMQMADILAANCDQSRPSTSSANPLSLSPPSSAPAPLSSFTALTCRPLETILAAQLPSLTPCNLPAGYSAEGINEYRGMHGMHMPDLSNWLRCDYDERSHRIKVIASHNLTLSCVDPSCPATPRLYMLLDSRWPEQGEDAFALYHVRLAHVIRRQATERIVPEDTFAASATPMSLSQLLSLIQLPVELLPRNLHDRVHFSDVHATLIVDSVNGVLTSVAGTATCGVSRADKLLFFNRLPAVASSLPESRQTRSILPHLNEVVHSPVVRWCSLQCRSVLDTAVFPSIHMYTSDRCVAPLYQYMLCETEGDVELSARATREFRAGHRKLAGYSKIHTDLPAQLRPTNALFALQPHLPSGYWEMPTSALDLYSSCDSPLEPDSTTSTSLSSPLSSLEASSTASRAVVGLFEADADVLLLVASYLDINSLLFGLLPAVHSLPSFTTAFNSDMYGRRVLLSRFGALCDAALWSTRLLDEWRCHKLRQDCAELSKYWK